MSCPNATSPIDIQNILYSICELKCDYEFSYPNSSTLWLKNNSDHISIKTEFSPDDKSVIFNEGNYQVHEIRIYVKSLHTYTGQNADAEMFIHHKNEKGGNDLLVCIPIVNQNSSNGESSEIFSKIFTELAKRANSKNSESVININSFSLNKLIPMKPYYSYKGTLPYKPCNGTYDIIVFSKNNGGYLTMTNNIYSKLSEIITTNNYLVHKKDTSNVFYNELGPSVLSNSKATSDDIFIDCQPTGADGESLVPVNKTLESALAPDISNLFQNKYFKMLIPVLIIIIVLKIGALILGSISKGGRGGGAAGASASISASASTSALTGGGIRSLCKKK